MTFHYLISGRRSFLLFLSFVLWQNWSQAENATVVPLPASGLQWRVDVFAPPLSEEEKQTKDIRPPSVVEENIVAAGIRKERKLMGLSKQVMERYAQKGWILYFEPETSNASVEPNSPEALGNSLSVDQLDEFAWLRPEFRRGQATYRGILCNVYSTLWPLTFGDQRETIEADGKVNAVQAIVEPKLITAYLAVDSGLPVGLESPIETRWYTFEALTGTLTLPAKLSDALNETLAAIKFRKQRYNIPQ